MWSMYIEESSIYCWTVLPHMTQHWYSSIDTVLPQVAGSLDLPVCNLSSVVPARKSFTKQHSNKFNITTFPLDDNEEANQGSASFSDLYNSVHSGDSKSIWLFLSLALSVPQLHPIATSSQLLHDLIYGSGGLISLLGHQGNFSISINTNESALISQLLSHEVDYHSLLEQSLGRKTNKDLSESAQRHETMTCEAWLKELGLYIIENKRLGGVLREVGILANSHGNLC